MHELKCWPCDFRPISEKKKKFEIRDDRSYGFRDGDIVILKEWDHSLSDSAIPFTGDYTGREMAFTIGYTAAFAQMKRWFSLLPVNINEESHDKP
jgi:hypothetical protein